MNLAAGALSFLVMTVYWPGMSGAATAPRWAAMALAAITVLIGPRIRITTAHVAGLAFLAWSGLTLLWSDLPDDGIGALFRLLLLATAFALGSQLASIKPVMIGAALGLAVSSAISIAQWNGWEGLPYHGLPPSGLFYNKNYMAEVAALVTIWLVAERVWWAVPTLLPALILPMARGALIAVAFAGVVLLWRRSRAAAVAGTGVALVAIGYVLLSASFVSANERIAIWRDTFDHLSLFGFGIGSFAETFPTIAHHFQLLTERPAQAHNDFLQVWFETGAVGFAIFIAFIVATMRVPFTAGHLVLAGILIEACFAFPFQMPATAFIGLLVAGHLARDGAGVGDAIARCRTSLHARLSGRARHQRGSRPARAGG